MSVALALVGSRHFNKYELFCEQIDATLKEWNITHVDVVVSGDARGADALAARWAREHNVTFKQFRANWNLYGKRAGPMHNTEIVAASTHVIAFPSQQGKGTQDTIRKASAANLPVHVFYVD